MASVFYSQACQMDTRIGPGSSAAQLNGAFFNLADSLAIILFTPVIAQIVIPCSERCLGRKVSLNMKIYAGILVAVAAQLLAAGMEYFRLRSPVLDIQSKCAPLMASGGHVHMSELSAWWMVIPYAMVGIGEILVNPSLQHFAYDGAHPSMRSLIQAFCLFAMGGMPNALSSAMSMATAEWTPNDLNQGNLPLVYMINALIGLVGCLVFRWVSRERLPLCMKEEYSESDISEDVGATPLGEGSTTYNITKPANGVCVRTSSNTWKCFHPASARALGASSSFATHSDWGFKRVKIAYCKRLHGRRPALTIATHALQGYACMLEQLDSTDAIRAVAAQLVAANGTAVAAETLKAKQEAAAQGAASQEAGEKSLGDVTMPSGNDEERVVTVRARDWPCKEVLDSAVNVACSLGPLRRELAAEDRARAEMLKSLYAPGLVNGCSAGHAKHADVQAVLLGMEQSRGPPNPQNT
ncbi:unnamed protein product [Polarella glacialis]|uniref:Uncharacterized protein n=1 Tax=Polarella glacialis TaxID=89957 RepID=A0A813KNH3_POLGL|nr:unnamed protein product [Polarella glacialis]